MAKRASTGGIGGTALGLLTLGLSSAVFGALVIGPRLNGLLGEEGKAEGRASYSAPSKEPDAETAAHETAVQVRPVAEKKASAPAPTAANPRKVNGFDELPCEDEEATSTSKPAPAPSDGSTVYRVRVGRYKDQAEAEKVRDEINKGGSAAVVFLVGDTYRVQIGAFRDRAAADRAVEDLRARSYTPEIDERKAE